MQQREEAKKTGSMAAAPTLPVARGCLFSSQAMTELNCLLYFSPFPERWPGFQEAEGFIAGMRWSHRSQTVIAWCWSEVG